MRSVFVGLVLFLAVACSDGDPADSGVVDAGGGLPDFAVLADAEVDAGVDAGGEPDTGRPPDVCDELQLPRAAFRTPATTYNFGDTAGDFTITELDGTTYNFSEHYSGCESYIFLNYIPTTSNFEDRLFDSDVEPMIYTAPLNSHFFFFSWEQTEELRRTRLEELQAALEEAIVFNMSEEDQAKHRARFHYAIERPMDLVGSVGAFVTDYLDYADDPSSVVDLGDRGQAPPPLPFAFAIDRDQRWDAGGNLNRYVGGPPAFEMAAYLPLFFDYKAKIRDDQAIESGVTKLELINTTTTGRIFIRALDLPDPASVDTMDFDVRIVCHERNVFACSEWDRIASIQLCADGTCAVRNELIRWITPYWRRGEQRWVIDASALLGLIGDAGRHYFRIELGPEWERPTPWEVQIALRLSNKNIGLRSSEVVRAFTGGGFNADYNMRAPLMFTPPATAQKVELVVILSGHGQVAGNNCAEWCDHRHQFTVNNTPLPEIRHEGDPGSTAGCGPAAARGVPPGQWGNWAPERAYWCPGMPVEHIRIDLTADVMLGMQNELTYSGNFAGGPPAGGDIALESYVVYSE